MCQRFVIVIGIKTDFAPLQERGIVYFGAVFLGNRPQREGESAFIVSLVDEIGQFLVIAHFEYLRGRIFREKDLSLF